VDRPDLEPPLGAVRPGARRVDSSFVDSSFFAKMVR
jgi:hypothetical protein